MSKSTKYFEKLEIRRRKELRHNSSFIEKWINKRFADENRQLIRPILQDEIEYKNFH